MPREFKTVLCPTDFSEASYRAIDYGLRFARNADGTLILLHVVHVPAGELYGPEAFTFNFAEAKAFARRRLEQLHAERLGRYPKCELVVDIGDPAEQTLAFARQRNVDLIVTATHGRSGLAHLILGSVAEKVIRHAPCPVLVIRASVE